MRWQRRPAVDLEPLRPGDDQFVRQLALYWLELGIAPDPRWAARYVERTYEEQGGPRHTFWAVAAGRRVGFGMVRLEPDWLIPGRTNGYIFYVFPAERRQGVGRALARRLVAFLRERGASAVELDVLPDNRAGMAFWRSLGFELSHHHLRLGRGNAGGEGTSDG
jgi:ribosomal protein S18 acetylase RimI-like enzyme